MPYIFYINLKLVLHAFNPHEETKISNKRNKGDDAPQTPLCWSGRHNPNNPVSYSKSQRKPFRSVVSTATTPLIHTAGLALTSSPVKDQRQLKTIDESHASSAVASADVGGLKFPTYGSEIEAGPIVPELGKESVVDPNKACMMSLNMEFTTLFFHAMIKKRGHNRRKRTAMGDF
jgi:hypothetical protein